MSSDSVVAQGIDEKTLQVYRKAGMQLIPIRPDGSKKPALLTWKEYQDPANQVDLDRFKGRGAAVVCGQASMGLEVMDFDDPSFRYPWCELVEDQCPGLIQRLVMVHTPRVNEQGEHGAHFHYRSSAVEGGKVLARTSDGEVAIETRGEGNYVLLPGCPPECHPTGGTYDLEAGTFDDIPTITPQEREVLLSCARALSEAISARDRFVGENYTNANGQRGTLPGDDYAAKTEWGDILVPHGWTQVGQYLWRRPGKQVGSSASTKCRSKSGNELLYNFSSNADPFEADQHYTKFAAYALLKHGGDYSAAAKALAELGYGKRDDSDIDLSGIIGTSAAQQAEQEKRFASFPRILSANEMIRTHPERRPVVVDGLVREGDVANVIAAPKVGKSWLALGLAASVAAGRKWLNCFDTTQGRVLYIDNELHPTDTAFRLNVVANELGLPAEVMEQWFHVVSFRGVPAELLTVLAWLRDSLSGQQPGYYKLAIVDTLSKMLAGDKSENDNLYIRSVYSHLENLTADLGMAAVIVHHASRGDQSEKAVTDVGAGAGSQSRAADAHMVIRPHVEEGWCVLDSTVRSFPGHPALSIQWEYPLWTGDPAKEPKLASKTSKHAQEHALKARRKVQEILASDPNEKFSINKLREQMEGFGPVVIRRACEELAGNNLVECISDTYRKSEICLYQHK